MTIVFMLLIKTLRTMLWAEVGGMANAVTILRIILSLALPFLTPLGPVFFVTYAVCGVTDMLDGYIARRTRTQSRLGARLDSVADLVLAAAMAVSLYPVLILPPGAVPWMIGIVLLRAASAFVAFRKFHALAILHTLANKATGFLIFLFPFFIPILPPGIHMWILCGAATLSALEELLIHLVSGTLDLNRKSIFTNK